MEEIKKEVRITKPNESESQRHSFRLLDEEGKSIGEVHLEYLSKPIKTYALRWAKVDDQKIREGNGSLLMF